MRLAIILLVAVMSSGCLSMTFYANTYALTAVPDLPIQVVIIDSRWPPPIIIGRDRRRIMKLDELRPRDRHPRRRHRHDR
jgi:hypothetical protein